MRRLIDPTPLPIILPRHFQAVAVIALVLFDAARLRILSARTA